MSIFFASWQLWEKMTFVLACAIGIVFLIGLFKLWQTSRQVYRLEIIDEEKRARLQEMRKVIRGGNASSRKHRHGEIPFGVRAIQSGVEVDGIWISRPTTPSCSSSKSKLGLSTAASDAPTGASSSGKVRGPHPKHQKQQHHQQPTMSPTEDDARASSGSGIDGQMTSQWAASAYAASTGSTGPSSNLLDTPSTLPPPLPQISEDGTFPVPPGMSPDSHEGHNGNACTTIPRANSSLNEEALRRLESTYVPTSTSATGATLAAPPGSSAPQLNTYIPSSRMSSPSPSLHRLANGIAPHAGSKQATEAATTAAPQNPIIAPASYIGPYQGSTISSDLLAMTTALNSGGDGDGGTSSRSNYSTSSCSSRQHERQKPQQKHLKIKHRGAVESHLARYYTSYASPSASTSIITPTSPVAVRVPVTPHWTTIDGAGCTTLDPEVPSHAHANKVTRKVNAGFEVLPAGTFGPSAAARREAKPIAPRNKLRRASGRPRT